MVSAKQRFLDYYKEARSKGTYKSYKRGLALFEEYYGKSCDIALKERREDVSSEDYERNQRFVREIEKFHAYLLKEEYSINTARTMTLGILQLFRYYGVPISLPPQSKVSKTVMSTKTYIPKIEQLRKMFQIADLREKVILSLGLDLAWRVNDFVKLKKEDIPDLQEQTPIKIEVITQKEDVISSTFISSETVELLKAYVPTLKTDNPYLFPSNSKRHLKDEAINKILKKLAKKAKIKIPRTKRFTFHGLRKRFLSTAYTLGIDHEVSKLLVGKSIGKSMETYLEDVNLKNAFIQIREEALSLSNGRIKSEIEMKDVEITKLKKEIEMLRYAMKGMAETFREQIEKKSREIREEGEDAKIMGDEEISPYEQLQAIGQFQDRKRKKEYDKMLAETNNFNNKS